MNSLAILALKSCHTSQQWFVSLFPVKLLLSHSSVLQIETIFSHGKMMFQDKKFDLCEKKELPQIVQSILLTWAIPIRCSFNQTEVFCYGNKAKLKISDISRRMISLFSTFRPANVRINIIHDTGISCFEAISSLVKI